MCDTIIKRIHKGEVKMLDFTYYAPTKVYFGRDKENDVGKIISNYGYKTIMMQYGKDSIKRSGLFNRVMQSCAENGITIVEMGGVALITADHGNADQMLDPVDGGAFTAHTTNLVPLILAGMNRDIKNGRLADLAPTMLEILGIEKPVEMTGTSLLK